MLSGYTCVASMWDRAKYGSSTITHVWTFAWTSPELLLYAHAHSDIGAVQRKTDEMADICVRIRYSLPVDRLLVERQQHSGAVVAMVGKAANG